jgi:PII-like signaling protein
MKGSQLTLYAANQSRRKNHQTVAEWILNETTKAGIQGATVFEAAEGFGAHGSYHAARFFELVDQPFAVTVAAEDRKIDLLLDSLRQGGVRLFYTRSPIEYDVIGADPALRE